MEIKEKSDYLVGGQKMRENFLSATCHFFICQNWQEKGEENFYNSQLI